MFNIHHAVLDAEKNIRPYIRETPLEYAHELSEAAGGHVFLKLENLQYTGSFKARGAINKLLSINETERARGIIAASTGNHGLAVAHGLKQLGVEGTIFLPRNASPEKIRRLRRLPADLQFHGTDCEATEAYAKNKAREERRVYISPYNDRWIIGGQGTIAVELLKQWEDVDCVMASVGGGGLISGIAGYMKTAKKNVRIVACVPENSPAMLDAVTAGEITASQIRPTLSDATAGGIENGAITLEPCRRYVDDWVQVSETEIQDSLKMIFETHRYVIEGSAGVVVAAFLKIRPILRGKKVALIICGGNIDIKKFKELVF